jgi:hypothetical protein
MVVVVEEYRRRIEITIDGDRSGTAGVRASRRGRENGECR